MEAARQAAKATQGQSHGRGGEQVGSARRPGAGARGEEAREGLRWQTRLTLVWEAAAGPGMAEASGQLEDPGPRRP